MRSRAASLGGIALVCAALAVPAGAGAKSQLPRLKAGVGRADITPPTGFPFGGWVRADRVGTGVHTRLQASALVLKSGRRKLALVAVDLFAAPGGLVKEAAARAGRGFSERNVLVSASHTHAGPFGFANFDAVNTVAPSTETITNPGTFLDFLDPAPADPQLYTFLVKRIATALRRANRGLAPAAAGWGIERLTGVTKNRSLEAHLADHGVIRQRGQGTIDEDPGGYRHTIDPLVSVLRVDRLRRGRRIPIGGWSNFANHGTVNPAEYQVYNQDHHGGALHVFERRIRRRGDVPRRAPVVAVYGNSNEGDQSAGLDGQGPAIAERVGRAEGRAMFRAWRTAGRKLKRRPPVDLRWTRVCFCGQQTSAGRVGGPLLGLPFLTGSEEGRGPLFDVTGVPLEGQRAPVEGFESHGHKIGVPFALSAENYPTAVPLFAIRVGRRMIVSLPGEPTVEVGRRARRAAVDAARRSGVRGAVLSGLANEFIQYLTTPEEYDRQHYEGGSTIFGPASSVLLTEELTELADRLARGRPAQKAYPFDPRNGVAANGAPYGRGAASAQALRQPIATPPGGQAVFDWRGGARGLDLRLDRRFISIERRVRGGWRRAADDLGLAIVWTVDDEGRYSMHWQVPRSARQGTYRVVVRANRYRLRSARFAVDRSAPDVVIDPDHPASEFAPVTNR